MGLGRACPLSCFLSCEMDKNLPSRDGSNFGDKALEMRFRTSAPELGTAGNTGQEPTLKLRCDGKRLEMAEQMDNVKLMITVNINVKT